MRSCCFEHTQWLVEQSPNSISAQLGQGTASYLNGLVSYFEIILNKINELGRRMALQKAFKAKESLTFIFFSYFSIFIFNVVFNKINFFIFFLVKIKDQLCHSDSGAKKK